MQQDQQRKISPIITVTLNTAIDRVLEVENFAIGEHLPAQETLRYPAGKGINVSRCLARLGRASIAAGFVGQAQSSQFEQSLADTGPGRTTCQLMAVRGQTRENITILDPIARTDTHIRTPGYELTRQDVQRIVSKLGLLAREGSIVVFSGSLALGMASADFDTLIYVALGRKAKVVLDVGGKLLADSTSLDLKTAGQGSSASTASSKMLWMIKPNRQELAEALGIEQLLSDAQLMEAGRRLTERVAWVVVTLGAEGAILFHEDKAWKAHCDVPADQVVSTVGCGDCLLAGILDAQAAQREPDEVLRWGVAAATANAMHSGVGEYDLSQVQQCARQTQVSEI